MRESPNPEVQLARSWEANATAWTGAVREQKIESRRLVTNGAILTAVLATGPKRVLDIGCGEGWLCRELASRGVDAVGIDGSGALVEMARREGGGRFRTITYEELAAEPSRVGASDFDAAVCNFALLEQSVEPMLRSVGTLLAPGGMLLIQTVHPWSACRDALYESGWRTEDFSAFGESFVEPMPWYFRTLGSWADLLRAAGFAIIDIREPVHPVSGDPLSLLFAASLRGD